MPRSSIRGSPPAVRRDPPGISARHVPSYTIVFELQLIAVALPIAVQRYRRGDPDDADIVLSDILNAVELWAVRHFQCVGRKFMNNVVQLFSEPPSMMPGRITAEALDRLVVLCLAVPEARRKMLRERDDAPLDLVIAGLAQWVGEMFCPDCEEPALPSPPSLPRA